MKDDVLLQLVSDELSDAEQNLDFETPLDYYLGNERGDEVKGRSQVISTDVADAIEWIKPQIMKSFTQNNEIVIFDPIHQGDEFQAELESQYVYEVLMKENDGFIILHQMVTDALLQNNGWIKIWHSIEEEERVRRYTGLTKDQVQAAVMHPDAEVSDMVQYESIDEASQQLTVLFDATVTTVQEVSKINIESVAPEDIRINSDHNSINPGGARFIAHLMTKSVSDLRKDGVDEETIKELDVESKTTTDYRFAAQGEKTDHLSEDVVDDSLKEVNIAECYMYADLDGDGISEYCKITVAGYDTPTVILDKSQISDSPWVSTTAIIMSHKWRGLSVYDRLKQIQDIKTTLLRNLLDNIYLQNNKRHKVIENQVTMSDLMTSRPGGVVRVKRQDAVEPLDTPPIAGDAFTMLDYMDQVRAGRSGVSPEGQLQQHQIGERVGSQGLERLMSAKEELVGLIVRIIAETGVKPLCTKIRELCTQHIDAIRDFQFRGQWVRVNPAIWPNRSRCTVRVGTGTGNHQQKLIALGTLMQKQAEIVALPGQTLVTPVNQFRALDDFCKFSGLNSAVGYFLDPQSPEGQQNAQQVMQAQQAQQEAQSKQVQAQLEFQAKLANAEMEKARIQGQNVILKGKVDKANATLDWTKQQYDREISFLKQQLDESKAAASNAIDAGKLDLERDKFITTTGIEVAKLDLEHRKIQSGAQTAKKVSDAA